MKKLLLTALAVSTLVFTSCSDDDDDVVSTSNLSLNISGLENLGADYVYEGWIIVNGKPVTTGTFTVDDNGKLSKSSFIIDKAKLDSATKFVLSIEPANDTDSAPAATKLLAGDFSGTSANVSSKNMLGDFSNAKGKYILATPTDGINTNELSGVWFLDDSSGSPKKGLDLPTLPSGWKYEGWVVIDGKPISTGTFTDPSKADDNATTSPYKGSKGNGPAYPGEDFIKGTISGVTFPTDLKGKTVVISVEPSPDNSAAPFTVKPLAHGVPANAEVHKVLTMGSGPVSEIKGTVSR